MAASSDSDATIPVAKVGRVVFGRYTLERIIGRGGMGVVWLARDSKLELLVALKFLPEEVRSDPDALRDLRRETKRALRLTHENIVRIYTLEEDADSAAIIMEYVEGKSLSALKSEQPQGFLDISILAPLVPQLCGALHYAHAVAGIVHRDLKPGNVLLSNDGTLKVVDFGIARGLQETQTQLTRHAGTTSGTLQYMSPQQMLGEKATPADDIYSLGATLFELVTGKPPFYTGDVSLQARTAVPMSMGKRRDELENIGSPIPAGWEVAVAACLEKDPARRPRTALDVAALLELGVAAPLPAPGPSGDETVVIPRSPGAAPPIIPLVAPGLPSAQRPAIPGKEESRHHAPPGSRKRRGPWVAAAAVVALSILAVVFWLKSRTQAVGTAQAPVGIDAESARGSSTADTPEQRQRFNALSLVMEDAEKTTDAAQRGKFLDEFLAKSRAYSAQFPDDGQVWVLRALASLELDRTDDGIQAARMMARLGLGKSENPKVSRVVAGLERKGWFQAKTSSEQRVATIGPLLKADPSLAQCALVNSLGMGFMAVPGTPVLFSRYETRVVDYQAFPATQGRGGNPGTGGSLQHPVTNVSWDEAKAFCRWLTDKERSEGVIPATAEYRLPTDAEWSLAVGLPLEPGTSPSEKNQKIKNVYPWGTQWPPPKGAGNYAANLKVDDFIAQAPVGSFAPNQFGLYDMGGNAWEWCEDPPVVGGGNSAVRTMRGASWGIDVPDYLLSSYRSTSPAGNRNVYLGFRVVFADASRP